MGTSQCQQCEPQRLTMDLSPYSPYHTIGEIEEKYRAYAQSNMLGFYSVRMQKSIERLYTLGQMHICDLIIQLTCEKQTVARDSLLDDVERIDLQQLDHLSLIEALPKNVQNQFSQTSSIFLQDEPSLGQNPGPNGSNIRRTEKYGKPQPGLRIINKYALKSQLNKQQEPFRNNFLFVIGTVGCFESQDVLTPSALPTKKSPLRIFLQKIEGASIKNRANILVALLVSPERQADLDEEVSKYHQQLKDDEFATDQFDPPFIKIQKILYKPIYPCVDINRKIQLTPQGNAILFNKKDGDLIGFIMQDPVLQGLLQKYEFVQVTNISNILQPIADKEALAYLNEHVQVDIVAPVVMTDVLKGKTETLKLKKHFVDRIVYNAATASSSQKQYQLTQSFYIRTILLTNKGSHFQKLIATRIKSKSLASKQDALYFYRTFQHVLYSPITLLLVTTNKNFALPQNQQVRYSNYCKTILGITDTKDDEIVEICPQILFGAKAQLQQIIAKLRNLQSVGFPLVLNRQKIEMGRNMVK